MTALRLTSFPLDHLALRGAAGAEALVVGESRLTYRELDEAVGRTAARLLAMGLNPGDRVATWMGKTLLACIMPLAAARAGLVHVPINPVLKHAQAAHILADSGARLLLANGARLESLEQGDLADAKAVALEEWDDGREALPASNRNPTDLAALLYTSGSTGRPKGVMLSHANLWLGAISVAHYLHLKPSDRTLCVLPLAFDYGQNQLLSAWAAGGCAIGFDYLLPRDLVRAIGRHDVTVLAGVPPLWLQIAEQKWDEAGGTLQTLTNSGGHLPEPLVRRLRDLFPQAKLHLMYGLTEAFRSSSLDPALVDAHPDSIGTAIPFAELMVVRPDGSEAAPGEDGELVHAGPLVALGYWNDPERTAERFKAAPEFSQFGGTAVWSGDTVAKGEDGLLRFRGRDDAMIKVSGNRISPTEIEEAALASGAVSDTAAFGVSDERLGQAIVLVAVANVDDAEAQLSAWLRRELPQHMQPQRIVWKDRLPVGPNGKLDRTALKAEIQ
ncbi:acyl-CoA ligase (AMP-forming), exosortase A system-associated [Sphingomonas sp. NSE70-1]|uniref:Acyl-CoA ligase (AMP-forming), exosortase A system-associated n=1 Tax=Sphingomonas caseinilyticus TaxID=2908205 RepID=A0ABT0RSD6_9SPHN|nr:acyl-CoA ligase (AMP-forming), exosortase A system-associated [Sphingomonas caseinilyticus]MCL6697748.1 acyl-CoA ligase (AMP-forming), exosortase A system-associated [Sphingomonas caseinilyticus]